MKFFLSICLLSLVFITNSSRAEEAKYLAHPEQALAAVMNLAESARSSIDLATFIFEPCDTSSQILMEILARKAREGVRVRLLLDALTQPGAQQKALADFAAKNKIELRFYNMVEKNFRIHTKLFLVDNKAYMSGGRNISDKYFGLSAEKNYLDRDILVRGNSALEAEAAFNELWKARPSKKKASQADRFVSWASFCKFDDSGRIQSVKEFLYKNIDILPKIPTRTCSDLHFIVDNPNFSSSRYGESTDPKYYMNPARLAQKRSSKFILDFINGARSTLRMENWVYIPVMDLGKALVAARKRNVRIDVITNRDTEDGPAIFREAMDYAVKVYAKKHSVGSQKVERISYLGAINDGYELSPPAHFFLHGKVYVRDSNDLVVGSFNLDQRSFAINVETIVAANNCPDLAADVEQNIARVYEIHAKDMESGRLPAQKEASFAAKLLAKMFLLML